MSKHKGHEGHKGCKSFVCFYETPGHYSDMAARPRAAKSSRIQNPASPSCFAVITACISCVIVVMAPRGTIAQAPDETTRLVQEYVRIDTANPPGDGIFPAAITAETAGSMHGDAEHVPLASIVEASEVLFDALRDTLAR